MIVGLAARQPWQSTSGAGPMAAIAFLAGPGRGPLVWSARSPPDRPHHEVPRRPATEFHVSDIPPADGDGREPTEEEVREYLERLRGAPVDQVIAEVATALLSAAQVKLGRNDGRLLIDLLGAMVETIRGRAANELSTQLDDALHQLRLAQVDAERQLGTDSSDGPDEGSTSSEASAPEEDGGSPPQSTGKRLWTPGG